MMYKRWVVYGWAVLVSSAAWASAGSIDPGLQQFLATQAPDARVSTLVYMQDMVDLDALTARLDQEQASLRRRHEVVVRALQEKAQATQAPLLAELAQMQSDGRVQSFESFWIANAVRVDAPAAQIEVIARNPSVRTIFYNYAVQLIEPVAASPAPSGLRAPEPGLIAIRADEAWALGYDGTGVLVANMDTGVDGNHPALASRWAGVADPRYAGHPEWAWRDALNSPPTMFPTDTYWHGTHTMGTVCGGAPGDQVGVAPGAHWIADNCINQGVGPEFESDVITGFQWFADPDGNPTTDWDVPAVISNSWGVNSYIGGYPPCDPTFWAYLDACEAVGTVILFSAGNEGPGANTLRRPADRATDDYRTCAVAAVDANTTGWPIAGFSSRGPTNCTPTGAPAIKPNIAAPGVSVRSCYPGGGYYYSDGTSMASPHVNGVVALMRQACPELSVQQIKQIIYDTAFDLGATGEDNAYGWGMIDAYEAVQQALFQCVPHPPTALGGNAATTVNTGVSIALSADDDGKPNPPGALSYIIVALPAHGHLLDANGAAILSVPYPLPSLGNTVHYQPNAYFTGGDNFTFKANDGGTPPEGGDSNVAAILITVNAVSQLIYSFPLDSDPGWSTQGQWAFGHPTGGGSHNKDPLNGHTGTNVYGYNLSGDYTNNMPQYFLTSAAINCAQVGGTQLRFYRWLAVEAFDHARVDVSNDGATWVNVWDNNGLGVNESAWSYQMYNIAATADGKASVSVRWGLGPTDGSVTFPGWNLDDVEIWGLATPAWVVGDLNCDGTVGFGDINPFVMRLSSPGAYWTTYPACADSNGDINGDGVVSFSDINPFVALLTGH
jgi:bacillopeptidase F